MLFEVRGGTAAFQRLFRVVVVFGRVRLRRCLSLATSVGDFRPPRSVGFGAGGVEGRLVVVARARGEGVEAHVVRRRRWRRRGGVAGGRGRGLLLLVLLLLLLLVEVREGGGVGEGGLPRPRGRRLLDGQLPLGGAALQVRQEAQSQRVLHVQALDGHQVPGHLRGALSEAQAVVVHRELVRVVRQRVRPWKQTSASRESPRGTAATRGLPHAGFPLSQPSLSLSSQRPLPLPSGGQSLKVLLWTSSN